ncbi:unnamed protein product [Closterium sp. NIES-53]
MVQAVALWQWPCGSGLVAVVPQPRQPLQPLQPLPLLPALPTHPTSLPHLRTKVIKIGFPDAHQFARIGPVTTVPQSFDPLHLLKPLKPLHPNQPLQPLPTTPYTPPLPEFFHFPQFPDSLPAVSRLRTLDHPQALRLKLVKTRVHSVPPPHPPLTSLIPIPDFPDFPNCPNSLVTVFR